MAATFDPASPSAVRRVLALDPAVWAARAPRQGVAIVGRFTATAGTLIVREASGAERANRGVVAFPDHLVQTFQKLGRGFHVRLRHCNPPSRAGAILPRPSGEIK